MNKELIAKLEVIRAMTDVEGVRQLADVMITFLSNKDFKNSGTHAIGFSGGDTLIVEESSDE